MKKQVQFTHANGFPAKTYSYLFEQFDDVAFHYVNCMGHGDFPIEGDLNHFADELIHTLEQRGGGPVYGVGHSSGAVATLFAAVRRPDLFKRVILLDPVLFSTFKRNGIRLMQLVGRGDDIGPTRKAMTRRTEFDDRDQARDYFRRKAFFRQFHPRCFDDYLSHGLKPHDAGLTLTFSAETEVAVFRSVPLSMPRGMRKVILPAFPDTPTASVPDDQVEVALIYGRTSDVLWPSDIRWLQWVYPRMNRVPFEGGHLFPFEQPDETVALLRRFLV
ncbi:alpha/beta fold hydrolase [Acanthopleuribacter pedis]|uniref:Alpha/beta hydrolase n=1 Tax=Acanthopleuribacter pedis TaxID=442870 RepID=A0A8J7U6S8_9BACT|nr:alpha/beta hydrolase [Acanthopleuribacter pedis]MBO1320691.1 alpha/beta hydrolase [Acanthopleuribacter pedis]